MAHLSSYLNVYNTALVIIKSKGWEIEFNKSNEYWIAKYNCCELLADDPMQLLGLISIYEYHKPKTLKEYWWKIDDPNLFEYYDPRIK